MRHLLLLHEPLVEMRLEDPDWKEEGRCRRGEHKKGRAFLLMMKIKKEHGECIGNWNKDKFMWPGIS